jgi:putative transposase
MVEELLAARGIELTYETVRRWSVKFGLGIARRIRSTALGRGDKWHLEEAVVTINGKKHWLWRAVDQHGAVLDVLVRRPARQARGQAAHAQAVKEAGARPTCTDYRQA